MTARPALAACALLALLGMAIASETGLSGNAGHPRARFPLTVYVDPLPDPQLDAAVRRAVDDWNALVTDSLGVHAFVWTERRETANATLALDVAPSPKQMGETYVRADAAGVIALPVAVVVFEPSARGRTEKETLFYQIVAHELGHVLGLGHTRDPASLMCCLPGSVDFADPVARDAYVQARRHPDLRSVRAQLVEHYTRFWRARQ